MDFKTKFITVKAAMGRKITDPSAHAADCKELLEQFLLLSPESRYSAVTKNDTWDKESLAVINWAAAHSMSGGAMLDISDVGDTHIFFDGLEGSIAKLRIDKEEKVRLNIITPSIQFPKYPEFGVITGDPNWSFASIGIIVLQKLAIMTTGLGRMKK